ncbi:ABC transporter permease [Labilibacter marinus]|uniref:ABC transporter permease n=1 Tax=Labilibacter marinus TaxID=1477105 RepID=UPI000832F6F9|nr:ABC transporter permease [Labilibacter marinus]
MLIQYLKSAWRNIWRNKLSSSINIIGLAVGLATGILAMLFSYHEISYEKCHDKADQIAKVITYGNFGAFRQLPTTFPQTAFDLPGKFPAITKAVRTRSIENATVFKDKTPILEESMMIAEPDLLNMFSFDITQGIYSGQGNTIILSDVMARKYFSNEDAIGKVLKIEIYGNIFHLTVEGIYKDLPDNTHLKSSAILSWNVAKVLYKERQGFHSTDFDVYCLLQPSANIQSLNQQIVANYELPVNIENCTVALMPIKDFHLRSAFENNSANLYLLFIGGCVALLIAIFNYVSQSTIQYSMRTQEVGIRLSNGGKSRDIFIQFMVDTLLITLLAFGICLLMLSSALPYFNDLVDTNISLNLDLEYYLIILSLFVLTVVLAGFYPSMVMAKVKPGLLLKSAVSPTVSKSKMRSVLTTVQFVFAILLIQIMIVSQRQGHYIENASITGFDAENVIAINGYKWGKLDKIKNELLRNSSIEAVSWGQSMPGMQTSMTVEWKGTDNKLMANKFHCESGYLDLFKIKMESGRNFSSDNKSDLKNGVLVNHLLVETMAWKEPIGKTLKVNNKDHIVLGIVSNYMAAPPIFDDTPLIILPAGKQAYNLMIRVNPNKRQEAHQHITAVLRQANPNYPINLRYYKEITYELAKSFISMATLVNAFVIIIILNAFLSLFGLSHFITERAKKQIGVKKVFGASIMNVYWELSKSFVIRFLIAFVIITPISYLFSTQYVATFSRQLPLTADIFIHSGLMVLAMLLLATSYKIIKSALDNPVEALRYE